MAPRKFVVKIGRPAAVGGARAAPVPAVGPSTRRLRATGAVIEPPRAPTAAPELAPDRPTRGSGVRARASEVVIRLFASYIEYAKHPLPDLAAHVGRLRAYATELEPHRAHNARLYQEIVHALQMAQRRYAAAREARA